MLKRLGGSPLPRSGLIAAKIATVVVVEIGQAILLLAVAALAFGWAPGPGASLAVCVAAAALGTLAFAGLGLLLAGTLRAEATLAIANGLFLALILLGGVVLPVDHLPAALADVARVLPAAALSDALRIGLGATSRRSGPAARPAGGLGGRDDGARGPDVPLGVAPGQSVLRSSASCRSTSRWTSASRRSLTRRPM